MDGFVFWCVWLVPLYRDLKATILHSRIINGIILMLLLPILVASANQDED